MRTDPPLSQHLARLAFWADRIRNGTHEITPQGQEDFAATLHLCAEAAEKLEADLAAALAARDDGLGGAVPRPSAEPPIPSDHLTTLVAIASGQVPGVVLLPVRHQAAPRFGEAGGPMGGDAA
ncbi:hypothetical protein PQJ75_14000 [Rhodoplanes sp. TEM]|uniref:Uncharacterized protein n=1 Tax=Rhodoplanes tepidamans TaxID=200616 RepID=A0ABT5JE94_RHOTP|nr:MULTISPECIES: hypothetical protein [Rhodoplanes]MDC7788005.1 hypothetical protein [Rhodoplanes tepidamans]MDC7984845.1 hypothetical protein [Rhodoplanes sp. TEM]MDQ0358434.1 hypothetical protein [Rhodoplanes tepidamans]